jgi:hypothetical protein
MATRAKTCINYILVLRKKCISLLFQNATMIPLENLLFIKNFDGSYACLRARKFKIGALHFFCNASGVGLTFTSIKAFERSNTFYCVISKYRKEIHNTVLMMKALQLVVKSYNVLHKTKAEYRTLTYVSKIIKSMKSTTSTIHNKE